MVDNERSVLKAEIDEALELYYDFKNGLET